MPPKKTLSYWLQRQQQLRGKSKAAKTEILRGWNAKSPDERRAWVGAYAKALDADNEGIKHQENVIPYLSAVDEFKQGEIQDARAFHRFTRVVDAAVNAVQARREAEVQRQAAWGAVRQLDLAQPMPNKLNTAEGAAKIAQAVKRISKCDEQLLSLKTLRENPPVPADAAGVKRILYDEVNEDQAWKYRQDAQQGPALSLAGSSGWRAQETFEGPQGFAIVFLHFDDHGLIDDRLVRKEVYLDEDQWRDPALWKGDIRDDDTRIPYEQACHHALVGVANLENVIPLREPPLRNHIFNQVFKYRLYQEYAPHGTLADLMKEHVKEQTPIPEPFIWYVAQSLAEAGVAMQYGLLDPGGNNDVCAEGWEEIVHRDLKPHNVLLTTGSTKRWPRYPKPALTDFGLAFMTSATDKNNPRWYNMGLGTEGFFAPEQQRWVDSRNVNPVNWQRLGSWTNVYGVGLVLRCLVTLTAPPETLWLGNEDEDETLHIPVAWPCERYSEELKDLIHSCLKFDTAARPTFQEILNIVNAKLPAAGPAHDLAYTIANPATRHANRVLEQADKYAIGTVLLDDQGRVAEI